MEYISKIRKTIPKWAKFPVFTLINREGNVRVLERGNHHARLPHHFLRHSARGVFFVDVLGVPPTERLFCCGVCIKVVAIRYVMNFTRRLLGFY